jgi:hypothetical protein
METFVTKRFFNGNESVFFSLEPIEEAIADIRNKYLPFSNVEERFWRGKTISVGSVEWRLHNLTHVHRNEYIKTIYSCDIMFGEEFEDIPFENGYVAYMLHLYKEQIIALAMYVRPFSGMKVTVLYYTRPIMET